MLKYYKYVFVNFSYMVRINLFDMRLKYPSRNSVSSILPLCSRLRIVPVHIRRTRSCFIVSVKCRENRRNRIIYVYYACTIYRFTTGWEENASEKKRYRNKKTTR